MKLTNIHTGKKYEVGTKSVRAVRMNKKGEYEEDSSKPIGENSAKYAARKDAQSKGEKVYDFKGKKEASGIGDPDMNKLSPKSTTSSISPSMKLSKIEPIKQPEAKKVNIPNKKSTPFTSYNKIPTYRPQVQVPTGNSGNKPTMASNDKHKGGGKNKLMR